MDRSKCNLDFNRVIRIFFSDSWWLASQIGFGAVLTLVALALSWGKATYGDEESFSININPSFAYFER